MLTCQRAFSPPRKKTRTFEVHGQVTVQTLLKPSKQDAMSTTIEPHENDVLMGRGGKNNQHVGNEKLREIAREHCKDYSISSKKGKSIISRDIVRQVRNLTPPGRFLRRNTQNGLWEDVGDDVAREKASQVLRDAVAQQMGPLAAVAQRGQSQDSEREATATIHTSNTPIHPRPASSSHHAHVERYPERIQSTATWTMENPTEPIAYTASPQYLPVTPVSSSQSRKRPRYYDTTYSYDHRDVRHRPARQIHSGTPPTRIYQHRPEPYHHPGYYVPHSSSRIPHSAARGRPHYVPMSAGHSSSPASHDQQSPPVPDLDLLHEELLSDQSDRDGARSPSPYRYGYHRDHHESV